MIDTELAIILNEYLYKKKIINFDLYNDALKKIGVDSWWIYVKLEMKYQREKVYITYHLE